jgi:hypothetical protein
MAYGGGCLLLTRVSSKTLSCRRCRSRIVEHVLLKQEARVESCSADLLLEKDERNSASHVSQHVEQAGRLGYGAAGCRCLAIRRE